jgi:predicted Zn finger-like uncharacterized protein
MAIHTVCPHCGKSYRLADEIRGEKVRCKGCQRVFVVTAMPAPPMSCGSEAVQPTVRPPMPPVPPRGEEVESPSSPPEPDGFDQHRESRSYSARLVISGIVGACVLAAAGVAVMWVAWPSSNSSERILAKQTVPPADRGSLESNRQRLDLPSFRQEG